MAAKSITERTSVINMKSPKAIADFAVELKNFVVSQKLFTPIKTKDGVKNYVNVEGWQFAGASMGILPVPIELQDISSGDEKKYKATVELVQLETGKVVGRGFAVCSSKESMRKSADEFAIASMAQTRATGKAFRLTIGWVMKLAGYEPTPSEEMEEEPTVAESTLEEIPIEDVRYLVSIKLTTMSAADKVKFMKDYAGTVNEKNISDAAYRRMYQELLIRSKEESEKQ